MGAEPERLRADVQELARVLRSGMTGVYSWNGVKTMVGRKLDALDALLAKVERLAGERDEWRRAAFNAEQEVIEARASLAEMTAAYKWENEDRERLAGRVEVAEKNADISAADAERWEAKALRLAGRVAELEAALSRWRKEAETRADEVVALEAVAEAARSLKFAGPEEECVVLRDALSRIGDSQ